MSGWTNITIEPIGDEEYDGPAIDAEAAVRDYIEAKCVGNVGPEVHTSASLTFQPKVRTLDPRQQRDIVEDIARSCHAAGRVLIIQANDTSRTGKGFLWEINREDLTSVEMIEEISGHEGAKGQDVQGEFADQYSIYGTASHGW